MCALGTMCSHQRKACTILAVFRNLGTRAMFNLGAGLVVDAELDQDFCFLPFPGLLDFGWGRFLSLPLPPLLPPRSDGSGLDESGLDESGLDCSASSGSL